MVRAKIGNGMRRVQAQAVKVKIPKPVKRILKKKVAHRATVRPIVIESVAPGGLVPLCDVIRAIDSRVVSVWPQVVVHDVEEHRETQAMRGVDEPLQVARRAVTARRREDRDAVVAPVA